MPALDILLPLLIGFIILFYILILWYVFYLWRADKRAGGSIHAFEERLDSEVQAQFQQSFDHLLQTFAQRADTSSTQIASILQEYQRRLMELIQTTQTDQHSTFADFTQQLQQTLTGFRQDLAMVKESVESDLKGAIHQKVEDLYETHKHHLDMLSKDYTHDIEVYKQQSMARADDVVKGYSLRVLQEVFADSLRDDDHERLFSAALERAKREGLFHGDAV